MGKKISELQDKVSLSGNERIPFEQDNANGSITTSSLKNYISEEISGEKVVYPLINKYVDTGLAKLGKIFNYDQIQSDSLQGTIVDVQIGRQYYITSKEVSKYVLSYVVLDANNKVLALSSGSNQFIDYHINLPENSSKIIVNNVINTSHQGNFYSIGDLVAIFKSEIKENKDSISQLNNDVINIQKQSNFLKNKNILMLGDSITEFTHNNKGIVEYFSEITQSNVIRGAIGGSNLARRLDISDNITDAGKAYAALDVISIVESLVNGNFSIQEKAVKYLKDNASDDNTQILNNLKKVKLSEIDIVTIFAGTNDSRTSGVILGESQDVSTTRNITGALSQIIKLLQSKNQNISIYVFTPIPRLYNRTNDVHGNANGNWDTWSDVYNQTESNIKLPEIANKIQEISKNNHIPCCNLYYDLGWNKYNYSKFLLNNSLDGTHPFLGFKHIAMKMVSFINSNITFI